MFGDAGDVHSEVERGVRFTEVAAGNRRGVTVMRRCGQRNMAFAGEKTGGRIEADPARAGQIDFAPGVKVGEIHLGAGGAVEGFQVRGELNEIAGDETCGEAEIAQDLDEQPARVAAGAECCRQRFLRRLDAGFHADDVTDGLLQARIDADDHVDRWLVRRHVEMLQIFDQGRAGRLGDHVDREVLDQVFRIFERPSGGLFLDEKIEGVVDRHVGDKIDLDLEFRYRVRENEPREIVAVGILLQVYKMVFRRDLQRMRQHFRARMGGGFQADDLGSEADGLVVFVMGEMIDACLDRHAVPSNALIRALPFSPFGAFPRMLFFGLVQRAGASLLQLSLCNAEEESKDDCAVISRME
ncbi:hypothetical protein D3C73_484780 [compost metagenome]